MTKTIRARRRHAALFRLSLLAFACAALSTCSSAKESSPAAMVSSDAPAPSAQAVGGYAAKAEMKREAGGRMHADGAPAGAAPAAPPPADGEPATPTTPAAPKQPRMLHYNGYAKLGVDSPRVASDKAIAIASDVKGFVENLNQTSVTLRVPVDKFRDVFRALLKLGDVIDKSVTAEDVTDAYGAITLRLETAKTSRDRLIGLLAKAKTEREKLDLLREIARLNQEIEALEGASRTLLSLARFSRITLAFEERQRGKYTPAEEPVAAFQWIHQLSPFKRDVAQSGKPLKMQVPGGFVALDEHKRFTTESADGCVYWASQRPNEPKGDAKFWRDAIKTRLGPEFATAEEKEAGAFLLLRFVDRADDAYRYVVGVRTDGDKLQIVEAHFPSASHEERYAEKITASMSKGAE